MSGSSSTTNMVGFTPIIVAGSWQVLKPGQSRFRRWRGEHIGKTTGMVQLTNGVIKRACQRDEKSRGYRGTSRKGQCWCCKALMAYAFACHVIRTGGRYERRCVQCASPIKLWDGDHSPKKRAGGAAGIFCIVREPFPNLTPATLRHTKAMRGLTA